ncbi:hypothetical protein BC936DRAFT_140980 [Jimgerdemannia flammicorona]|uniref:Uncharacterized protein n=1 Tax=Jimgerdemannia flammicorona TaxID=994334 RepID=A0A433DGF6_9FUNG|nr:hypothetical protein BC936DRAFT_140980 [Jimgerdemannia flammicorona]
MKSIYYLTYISSIHPITFNNFIIPSFGGDRQDTEKGSTNRGIFHFLLAPLKSADIRPIPIDHASWSKLRSPLPQREFGDGSGEEDEGETEENEIAAPATLSVIVYIAHIYLLC